MAFNKRIVNIRYTVNNLHFDAAIDCDWTLHAYSINEYTDKDKWVPIELYCFEHPEWGIYMMYLNMPNKQQVTGESGYMLNTQCDIDLIIKETKKWIEDELSNNE